MDAQQLWDRAKRAKRESRFLDFKASFDVDDVGDWCELLKDLVAMANSGGGVLLFGVADNGSLTIYDHKIVLNYDSAKVVDKVARYTGCQFADFEIGEVERRGKTLAGIVVSAIDVPMIFTKAGTYRSKDGRDKIAFQQGTIYFRHGAKSEPATSDDLRRVIERQVEHQRKAWLKGIKKVVKAPLGHAVTVVSHPATATPAVGPLAGRVVTSKEAPGFYPIKADDTWPHRGIDAIRAVNERLQGRARINTYDISAIRSIFLLEKDRPDLVYRPFAKASPHYSDAFVRWLCDQYERDPDFFRSTRERFKGLQSAKP
jgi:hypothetical protein